ncbi:hypothetical protein AMATHDRAFT_147309 [Amanita thiersii Skay4041]|uniref:Uncharacterized protein n=1 Tax=Amanita thiersii Skay4041 TaxID=703135 RepID=A0A2A9NF33_9AGAR|nr:hypothetical protein AMATHDRAFT_147309 [Amanita thiersii Skay4041]
MLCRNAHRPVKQLIHTRLQARLLSDLGLRSNRPPDTESHFDPDNPPPISDQEWEIRTGRAIFVLQNTFPDFFNTGLVTSVDTITGMPGTSSFRTMNNGSTANRAHPLNESNESLKSSLSLLSAKQPTSPDESIYSSKIRLSYTPPIQLPPPFPKILRLEGLPLYIASSAFVRHTLKALYTDLHVELRKFEVWTPNSDSETTGPVGSGELIGGKKRLINREKSLLVGLKVVGIARVSGAPGEWNVSSTYTFSPISGLILTHVVNSIHPAPHQAVYDSLRASLGKMFGWGLERPGPATDVPRAVNASHNRLVAVPAVVRHRSGGKSIQGQ